MADRRRGTIVVVAGPDGSGKTAVADGLAADVLSAPVLRLHHRPAILPAKTRHEGPVTEPHKAVPYPTVLSWLKVVYLFGDYALGWWLRLKPAVRSGGNVVFERGWWDLLVDQRRYRLQGSATLIRLLGRALPRPDATIVLEGEPQLLHARKAELGLPELARQRQAWRSVPASHLRGQYLDVAAPVAVLLRDIARLLEGERSAMRWTGLPRPASPRWTLPSGPRQLARGGLRVYHPVTRRGVVAWHAARLAAGAGAMRLLPSVDPPPDEVTGRVAEHVPGDSVLAVARTNHAGNWAVLVMDPRGRPRAFAKVALEVPGREDLAREAEATQRFRALVDGGVRVPAVQRCADGLVLFEAVAWQPRARPWLLPVPVAAALGRLFVSAGGVGRGPSHGDCAPWNLLHSGRDWYLIDWAGAHGDGRPFHDVLHYLVQAHALLGRPGAGSLLAGLRGRGGIGEALRAYADAAGLPVGDAPAQLLDYLERSKLKLDPRRADELRGLRARDRLLAGLADA